MSPSFSEEIVQGMISLNDKIHLIDQEFQKVPVKITERLENLYSDGK